MVGGFDDGGQDFHVVVEAGAPELAELWGDHGCFVECAQGMGVGPPVGATWSTAVRMASSLGSSPPVMGSTVLAIAS